MTDLEDPVAEFRAALPAWARAELRMTDQAVADVHLAAEHWASLAMLANYVAYSITGLANADQGRRSSVPRGPNRTTLTERGVRLMSDSMASRPGDSSRTRR